MLLKPTDYICPLCNNSIVIAQIHVKSTITVNGDKRYNIECPKCQGHFQSDLKLEQARMANSRANLFKPLGATERFFISEGNNRSKTIVSKYTVDPDWRDYDETRIINIRDNIEYLKDLEEQTLMDMSKEIAKQTAELKELEAKREAARLRLIERGELDVNDL